MTRSIEMIGSANLQGNLPDPRRLTAPSIKRNDTKSLFTTLTKVPQCNESRTIENILGDFKEVYRLVSREKDYSTIVGIIPSTTDSVPSSQMKKLQVHSPGSYLDKLQNSAIRLKTENKGDCKMGPEEYEFPNESLKCDIKEVLEQMIVNIAPITPLPSTPATDRFSDVKKTFKNSNQSILKDRTNLTRNIIKPIKFVRAGASIESKPSGPKSIQEINTITSSQSDITNNSTNRAIITKSSNNEQNNQAIENDNSDSNSSSSSSDCSGSSDSESYTSGSEDSDAKNKQIVRENNITSSNTKPAENQCTKIGNILVPVCSLSDSSSEDEEPSKAKPQQLANEINSLNASNKIKEIQNFNNDFKKIDTARKPNSMLGKRITKSSINGIVTQKSPNQFSEPQISQQHIKQSLIQTKNCTKRQVNNLQNRGPTYRTYPLREVGKKSKGCSRQPPETVPNSSSLSHLNTSFTQNDTKICIQSSQSSETPKPLVCETNVLNTEKNSVEKLVFSNKSYSAKSCEETESHFKLSRLSGSSSSGSSSSSSSSSSNSSSSSDSSSSSNSSPSSSDSEEEESPTSVPINNSSDSQNTGNITTKNILSTEKQSFTKLGQHNKNESCYFPIRQNLESDDYSNLKSITPTSSVVKNLKNIQKTLEKNKVDDIRNTLNCNVSKKIKQKTKNESIKSSSNTSSKNIKYSKIKSREFIEDSDSSSDEGEPGNLSAARIRPFTNKNKKTKLSTFKSELSSTTPTVTEILDVNSAKINHQPSQCEPNFVAKTVTISTIIPGKMNEQPSSSDADSESEPDDIIEKECNKKFKVDRKKKQALPKVFGRMLFKGRHSESSRSKISSNNQSNKIEIEISKTETFTSPNSENHRNEKERTVSSTSTSTSDSMNRTPIKLKIDLKRLRCVKTEENIEQVSQGGLDHKEKCDQIVVHKQQKKAILENDRLSKIPIKKEHHERTWLTDHRRKTYQTKSIDQYDQPEREVKQNNHLKKTTSNLISSETQPKITDPKIVNSPKTDNTETKQKSESTKRKRPKHENKDKALDFLFTPDYTKTKDNRYLPNPSALKKQDDKVLKRTESPKVETVRNNSLKTPKSQEDVTLKSPSLNVQNSSILKDNKKICQRSLSSDRKDKDHQKSSLKHNENGLSKSKVISKDDRTKKHKRESFDDFRHKHRKSECDSSSDRHQKLSSNNLDDKNKKLFCDRNQEERENKQKTPKPNLQKSSSPNRKGSSSKNKRDDLKERSSLKISDHKSHKQEENMRKDFEGSVNDATVKGQRTGSGEKESGSQSSLSNKTLSRTDRKPIKPEETHSKGGIEETKPDRTFLAPAKPALGGNSHSKGGRTSSDSSTDLEKPIKRRKTSANNCAGKKVKISQEQGDKEPKKADPVVSPISSDWICDDDDESDEKPGEMFANYASFVHKIDEIETFDRDTLISRGRELKHAADTDCYHMRQVLLYLDSCLYYMRATAISVPNDRTAASRLSLETLPLISFTRKRCSIDKSSEKNKDKFRIINILCLRCEGILYNHLFKLKQHQCFEVMKEVEDFLDTGKGDLLRENTPPSSSPGREHPFLPSNRLLNTIQRQNAFLQYLTHSQMLWEKADKLTANFENFFRELNVEYGEMSVYKPMTHVYNFTRGAIAKLLKQQQ